MAGLEIDATFRAGQEAAPVDDNGDELFIGVVVERVPADTSRSGVELIRVRIEATNASVFRRSLLPPFLVAPAGVSQPGVLSKGAVGPRSVLIGDRVGPERLEMDSARRMGIKHV